MKTQDKTMKRLRFLLVLSMTAAGFLLAGTAANADTVLTLLSPNQIGLGTLYTFDATVTNTGVSTVYLNGDFFLGDFPPLTYDDSGFNNFPLYLNPGDSFTGELFTVTTPPYGPGSNYYTGSFEFLGGSDVYAQDTLATANFDIDVIPEPSSFVLLLTGMAVLAGTFRRRLIQ
jgi:hypothetical protein